MPPPLEVECLKALWDLGEGTVHGVMGALGERKLKYTTVMTLLDRLEKRGAVGRRKVGRSFVYSPRLSAEELRRSAVKDLVDRLFDGDGDALKRFLISPNGSAQD